MLRPTKIMFLYFFLTYIVLCSAIDIPGSVRPINYNVHLEININGNDSTFFGSNSMIFEITNPTDIIYMHARELTIDDTNIYLHNKDGANIAIESAEHNITEEVLIIRLKDELRQNVVYNLTIGRFDGKIIYQKKSGINLAQYEENNENKTFVLTQFEKRGARQVFPCIDEPFFKASFTFSIVRPSNYFTLFTTDVKETRQLNNEKVEDTFYDTPVMAPYSLAFIISQFANNTRGDQTFFARPDVIFANRTEKSMDIATKSYEYLKKYFNVELGVKRMYHVAVPDEYFGPNGMENFGLIVYQENSVLFPSKHETRLTETIIHELVHQWFGNLVIIKSWKYTWLKEGLASYLAFYLGDQIYPSLKMMDSFVLYRLIYCFEFEDGNDDENVSPLTNDKSGVPEIYVSYLKAPSVIHTLRNFIGDDLFQAGLTEYLSEFKHNVAQPTDFYSSFQKVIEQENKTSILHGLTINEIMETWETQLGYPLVTAIMDYETGSINLTQERFLKTPAFSPSKWHIPIKIKYGEQHVYHLLKEKNQTINILPSNQWYLLNSDVTTYMRVNYDRENWERLAQALDTRGFSGISLANQLQLVSDAFALAKSKQVGIDIPLKISWHLRKVSNIIAIRQFLEELDFFKPFFFSNDINNKLSKEYLINILSPMIMQHGCRVKENDDKEMAEFKYLLMSRAVIFKEEMCTKSVMDEFKAIKANETLLAQTHKYLLCSAMRTADFDDYKFLYQKYESEVDETRKSELAFSLGCVRFKSAVEDIVHNLYYGNKTIGILDRTNLIMALLKPWGPAVPIFLEYAKNNTKFNKFEAGYLSKACSSQKLIAELEDIQKVRNDLDLSLAQSNKEFLENHEGTIKKTLHSLLQTKNKV